MPSSLLDPIPVYTVRLFLVTHATALLFVRLEGTYHDGSRLTEVVNKQEVFLPPRLLLSAYVERMS